MRQDLLERREAAAHVVEYPVQQQPDAALAAPRDQLIEVRAGAQAGVDAVVVNGVVAV